MLLSVYKLQFKSCCGVKWAVSTFSLVQAYVLLVKQSKGVWGKNADDMWVSDDKTPFPVNVLVVT